MTDFLPTTQLWALAAVVCGWLTHAWMRHRKLVKKFDFGGQTHFIDSQNVLSEAFPKIRGFCLGLGWHIKHDYRRGSQSHPRVHQDNTLRVPSETVFDTSTTDILPMFGFFPRVGVALLVADASVATEITTVRSKFPKPLEVYDLLALFGSKHNILISDGAEWKKHRKVASPAFAEGLLELWDGRDEIILNDAVSTTTALTLMVISAVGFGMQLTWKDDVEIPQGHAMMFKMAMQIVTYNLIARIVLPDWAFYLTGNLRKIRTAFKELDTYMHEMIRARSNPGHKSKTYEDILSYLLVAADDGDGEGEVKLTEEEMVSNVFIFLVAGHETSSHTLGFSLAYLALYPEVQRRLYEELNANVEDPLNPSYSDMAKLPYTLAVIYETLRHHPQVGGLPKYAAQDVVLRVSKKDGTPTTLHVPAGTRFSINLGGLHHNPRYWDDPDSFDPTRFLKEYPKEAFIPFSAGPRSCLGRRFAETESVAILAMLVGLFEIRITEEPQFAGETVQERKERVLRRVPKITTTPLRIPLTFRRRGHR